MTLYLFLGVGLWDSLYLLSLYLRPETMGPGCAVGGGCEAVAHSAWSDLAGVPLPAIGAVYYGFLLLLFATRRPAHLAVGAGLAASLLLVGVQAFAVRAFCPFCLLSSLCSLGVFWRRADFTHHSSLKRGQWFLSIALGGVLLVVAGLGERPRPLPNLQGVATHSLGPADARLRMLVISDLRCPHCAALWRELREFQASQPKQVRLTSVLLPLQRFAYSQESAYGAQAAGRQDRYFQFVDLAYQRQAGKPELVGWARQVGLDVERFLRDDQDPQVRSEVDGSRARLDPVIRSVPALFLNESQVSSGSRRSFWERPLELKPFGR